MVHLSFERFEEQYAIIRQSACGRVACSVLILVALEVDAMAAAKMLTQLLRGDNIAYIVRPVANFDDVKNTISNNLTTDIKTVFMVNCGAIYDIPKHFNLEQGGDMRCYILDNHRPIHLKNIYSRDNVVVFDEEFYPDDDNDLPSEASEMSSVVGEDDSGLESEEDDFDEEDDEEEDEDEEAGEAEEEGEGDEEFNPNDITREEGYAFDPEAQSDDAAEEDKDVDEEKGDSDSSAEKEDLEGDDIKLETESRTGADTEAADANVLDTSDVDKTFVAPYMAEGDDEEEEDAMDEDAEGEEGEEEGDEEGEEEGEDEGEDIQGEEDDEEEGIRVVGKKRRTMVDPSRPKRQKIHQYYCKAVSYTSPTALLLLPFVKSRFGANGHMPLDITWQAILGITDQYKKGRLSEMQYEECCEYLKMELGEHLVSSADRVSYSIAGAPTTASTDANALITTSGAVAATGITIGGAQQGHIQETAEYRFYLHRHWSIYEAMYHSMYIASRFAIWNSRGTTKLQELLAEMGVPLHQCKQSFQFMTPECRQHFREQIKDTTIQEKYKLSNPDVTYKSFCRFTSYKNPIAAEDIVQAATALLELYAKNTQRSHAAAEDGSLTMSLVGGKENVPPFNQNNETAAVTTANKTTSSAVEMDTFFEAYELLGTRNDPIVKKGIHLALDIQRTIVKKASAMLDGQDSIHRYHRIYYAYIRNNLAHSSSHSSLSSSSGAVAGLEREFNSELIFGRTMVLARLGQFIMEVKRNQAKKDGGWSGSSLLPLVLLSERQDSTYLVMGISPFCTAAGVSDIPEDQQQRLRPLTNFRQFFKLAAKDMHIPYRCNSFDPNVVEIAKEDTQDFLGALDNVLKKATPNFFARGGN